jgi:hypothetical protein
MCAGYSAAFPTPSSSSGLHFDQRQFQPIVLKSPAPMAATRSWDKSTVIEGILSPFVMQGNITAKNYRIPKATETEPAPQAGEYVTIFSHLERCFGIPSSLFFQC